MVALISLEQVAYEARAVILRFPLAMVTALLGTILGIMFIEAGEPSSYIRPLMVLALGFPLFVALEFLSEDRQFKKDKKILVNVGAIVFLAAYYFLLPSDIEHAEQSFIIRYLLWGAGFVLLVTFMPFLKNGRESSIRAFWQFNKELAYSLMLTGIWGAALQAGISIALASIDFLFKVDILDKRFAELFIVLAGIFATTFFLSRVPRNLHRSSETEDYPKELRLFSAYVLVPLVVLYFLILYAYVVRILMIWEWPEGTLAYMVLGFSLLGVLVNVCLYPLRHVAWVRKMNSIFYLALIPQIGMLFWALWFRIAQYGFTENRYFVVLFGVWLLAIALYFLISSKKDIRIIPITLFCGALLSSFGPWGALAFSERSQVNRLEGLLAKNNLLVNDKVQKSAGDIALEDRREISAILEYLDRRHGLEGIAKWFGSDFSAATIGPETVATDFIGIEYVEDAESTYFYFAAANTGSEAFPLAGYEYMKRIEGGVTSIVEVNGETYSFEIDNTKTSFVVERDSNIVAEVDLKPFLDTLSERGGKDINQDLMKIESRNSVLLFTFYLNHVSGQRHDGAYSIESFDGTLLFSL